MILNFQIQKQLLNEWCWAAVASSISFKYDPNSIWQQSKLAAEILSSVCINVDPSSAGNAPQVCHQEYKLSVVMQNYTKNSAWMVERVLTLDEIRYQINSGWPICCQIYWQSIGNAHYIVIYGYEGNTIIIGDPEAGVCSADYDDLVSGYRGGQWNISYGTQSS